jgi:hypothetical protein
MRASAGENDADDHQHDANRPAHRESLDDRAERADVIDDDRRDDEADCEKGVRRDHNTASHATHRRVRGSLNGNQRSNDHRERTQQYKGTWLLTIRCIIAS